MLRLGASPHEQQWRLLFTVSTVTTKGLDAKHRRNFNAEAEAAFGQFYRELAISSVKGLCDVSGYCSATVQRVDRKSVV